MFTPDQDRAAAELAETAERLKVLIEGVKTA